jgi:3-hydroxyisobutyrate dehydrogenase-like beta-hydroxyacid dehydrogenase
MICGTCALRSLVLFASVTVLAGVATAGDDTKAHRGVSPDQAVTIVGLGHMGSVLAKTFIDHGLKVTLWNRTASKAEPLIARGAVLARSPRDAIAASPLTIISLTNKAITRSILDSPGVADALKGRTIVDLSSGSAAEARNDAALITAAGGSYLDGGIMEYPRSIGRKDAVIVYSGSAATFRAQESTLAILAGNQRYLGEDVGAAATTYLALWNYYFVALAGYFEGAALAQTAGVGIDEFRSLTATMAPKFGDAVADANRRINTRDYSGDQAPVDEYLDFFEQTRQAEAKNGVGHRGAEALIGYVESAQKAGDGDKDIAVLFKAIGGRD